MNFQRDSWTAPLGVCRVHPDENVHTVAAARIRRVLQELPAREIDSTRGRVPILLRHGLFDHPRAPVIRMVSRIYDQPDQPI